MSNITQTYRFEKHRIFEINDQWITRSSVALAREIGDNAARLLLQLEYLIATSHNERDGRLWTYQSLSDLETMFPWSKPTIQRAIKSLEKQNLITVTGKYNRKRYDRTNWFAINFEGAARLKSIKIATDQNETRSIQNEMTTDQNETRIDQNETTIPKRSTERSTKSSTNTLRANARGEIDGDDQNDQGDQITKTLTKDRDPKDRAVREVEESLLRKLKLLIPVIPRWKNQNDALRQLASTVAAGTCIENDVLRCAEDLVNEHDLGSVTPLSILNHLGGFLARWSGRPHCYIYDPNPRRPELYDDEGCEYCVPDNPSTTYPHDPDEWPDELAEIPF